MTIYGRLAILAAAALSFSTIALLFTNDRIRISLVDRDGSLTSGTVMGVSLGDSRVAARQALTSAGLEYDHSPERGRCGVVEIDGKDITADIYMDKSMSGGIICLLSRADSVTGMNWRYRYFWP